MKFSICVITYNRIKSLKQMLKITKKLDYKDYEILILNQNSNDGTLSFLQKINDDLISVFNSEINLGVAGGRNFLAKKAKGEYLIFLDDDSWFVEKSALNKIELYISKFKADIFGFKIIDKDSELRDWCYPISSKFNSNKVHYSPYYVGCGHAIKKETFDDTLGYNENLFFWGEEIDFVLKSLTKRNIKIIYLPDIIVMHVPSQNARFYWSGKRLYYKTRNRFYLFKYFKFSLKKYFLIFGFLIRFFLMGIKYRNLNSVLKGIYDSNKMHVSDKICKETGDNYLRHYILGRLNLNFFKKYSNGL